MAPSPRPTPTAYAKQVREISYSLPKPMPSLPSLPPLLSLPSPLPQWPLVALELLLGHPLPAGDPGRVAMMAAVVSMVSTGHEKLIRLSKRPRGEPSPRNFSFAFMGVGFAHSWFLAVLFLLARTSLVTTTPATSTCT